MVTSVLEVGSIVSIFAKQSAALSTATWSGSDNSSRQVMNNSALIRGLNEFHVMVGIDAVIGEERKQKYREKNS